MSNAPCPRTSHEAWMQDMAESTRESLNPVKHPNDRITALARPDIHIPATHPDGYEWVIYCYRCHSENTLQVRGDARHACSRCGHFRSYDDVKRLGRWSRKIK